MVLLAPHLGYLNVHKHEALRLVSVGPGVRAVQAQRTIPANPPHWAVQPADERSESAAASAPEVARDAGWQAPPDFARCVLRISWWK